MDISSKEDSPDVSSNLEFYINELGLNSVRSSLRESLENEFLAFCDTSLTGEKYITKHSFLALLSKRGHATKWVDAAFQAFDFQYIGKLTVNEFMLAVCALTMNDYTIENKAWIHLRRLVVLSYYDEENTESISKEYFLQLLSDISRLDDEPSTTHLIHRIPEVFGIKNTTWRRAVELHDSEMRSSTSRSSSRDVSYEDVVERLTTVSVSYAELLTEHEQLQLKYKNMEEQLVAMKYQWAMKCSESAISSTTEEVCEPSTDHQTLFLNTGDTHSDSSDVYEI